MSPLGDPVPPGRCRTAALLARLDLRRPDLAPVRRAWDAGDPTAARAALLDHYRAKQTLATLVHDEAHHPTDLASAAGLLAGEIILQGLAGPIAVRSGGGIDWADTGPRGDREWAWFLNRHLAFATLVRAYQATGDDRYAEVFDTWAADWLAANPYTGGSDAGFAWRPMEAGSRMLSAWPLAFYGFQEAAPVAAETRLAMLDSIADHADCLVHHHRRHHNHAIKEMAGLVTLAIHWPEFRQADDWLAYGLSVLEEELAWQLYPDGAHKELCAGYHVTVLTYVQHVVDLTEQAGHDAPARFKSGVRSMRAYLEGVRRPNGHGPQNNDSDDQDLSSFLPADCPRATQSRRFPWAGQLVMRGGGTAEDQWAFFDAGPAGTAKSHAHRGRLHLSVSAHGRDLLVDSGRHSYRLSPERDYFTGSQGHNVLLVDGCGQCLAEPEWPVPRMPMAVTGAVDYARGRFEAGFDGLDGVAVHERVVVYIKPRYWLVVDHLATDRPRHLTALWHFHPDCTVAVEDGGVVSSDTGRGNLRVSPLGPLDWRVETTRGRPPPDMQGWWSPAYNRMQPGTTAQFHADTGGSATFAWLLTPAMGVVPAVDPRWVLSVNRGWVAVKTGADRIAVRIGDPQGSAGRRDVDLQVWPATATTPISLSDAALVRALQQEEAT